MSDLSAATAHLEDAEAAIMSHVAAISSTPDDIPDDQLPDALPMLLAVLRSVSRAAGIIEGADEETPNPDLILSRDGGGRLCAVVVEGVTFVPYDDPNLRGRTA